MYCTSIFQFEYFVICLVFDGLLQLISFQMFCSKHSITFDTYLLSCRFYCVDISYINFRSCETFTITNSWAILLYPRVLIPATEKVIKPRPYRIYRQKTGSCFWSVNYTRSKISFLCSGNKLQVFKYPPF